jgi:syntaxin 18
VASLRTFITANQQRYAQHGRLKEAERDAIEEEISVCVRACSSNIAKLQEMMKSIPAASPAKRIQPNPELLAHRQGIVLILSERLVELTAGFDRLRSLRYRQLQREEESKRRRTPQAVRPAGRFETTSITNGLGPLLGARMSENQNVGETKPHRNDVPAVGGGGYNNNVGDGVSSREQQQDRGNPQQQSLVYEENLALQEELLAMTDQVQVAERTVREIATLNQMFSTAILHQSEQIEQLYVEAVEATGHMGKANVQLDKAVKTNRASQKLMFIVLLVASLALLFLDWYYS